MGNEVQWGSKVDETKIRTAHERQEVRKFISEMTKDNPICSAKYESAPDDKKRLAKLTIIEVAKVLKKKYKEYEMEMPTMSDSVTDMLNKIQYNLRRFQKANNIKLERPDEIKIGIETLNAMKSLLFK